MVLREHKTSACVESGNVPRMSHFAFGFTRQICGPIVVRKDAESIDESQDFSVCKGGGRKSRPSSSFG